MSCTPKSLMGESDSQNLTTKTKTANGDHDLNIALQNGDILDHIAQHYMINSCDWMPPSSTTPSSSSLKPTEQPKYTPPKIAKSMIRPSLIDASVVGARSGMEIDVETTFVCGPGPGIPLKGKLEKQLTLMLDENSHVPLNNDSHDLDEQNTVKAAPSSNENVLEAGKGTVTPSPCQSPVNVPLQDDAPIPIYGTRILGQNPNHKHVTFDLTQKRKLGKIFIHSEEYMLYADEEKSKMYLDETSFPLSTKAPKDMDKSARERHNRKQTIMKKQLEKQGGIEPYQTHIIVGDINNLQFEQVWVLTQVDSWRKPGATKGCRGEYLRGRIIQHFNGTLEAIKENMFTVSIACFAKRPDIEESQIFPAHRLSGYVDGHTIISFDPENKEPLVAKASSVFEINRTEFKQYLRKVLVKNPPNATQAEYNIDQEESHQNPDQVDVSLIVENPEECTSSSNAQMGAGMIKTQRT